MQLIPPKAPNLPLSPTIPDRQYSDQVNNALRLYFNKIDATNVAILGPQGGQYIDCPNGLFFNTADQTFGATNTAYPVEFNATYLNNAVQLKAGSTSQITVTVGGVYNFQYTGQVLSSSASAKTIYLWIARNGTDVGYSTRAKTVSSNGQYTDVSWNFDIDLDAGEYVELQVAVSDTNLTLDAVTATSPHPGIPSSVMSVNFIAPLPSPRPTPP